MQKRILVTDATYKHALGIVRALGKAGYRPYVLSFSSFPLTQTSRFCGGVLRCVPYSDPGFREALLSLLERHEIEQLIPVGTDAFRVLVPMKAEIEHHCHMVTVDEDKLNLCFSKEATYRFAEKLGISVPHSFYPRTRSDLDAICDQIRFPCIIKGPFEVGGNIVAKADSRAELKDRFSWLCDRHSLNEETGLPLVQEFIDGFGCGFFAVYDNGQCGPTFQHRRIREMPPSGGYSVAAQSFDSQAVHVAGKTLLDALEWHGVAMVEFRMRNGVPYLMEINPKFWGSLDLALEAGVNFPLELIKIADGVEVSFSRNYAKDFRYHWPCHGDLDHMLLSPARAGQVLHDCFTPSVRSNLWWRTDFLPTLYMIMHYLVLLPRRLLKMLLPERFIHRLRKRVS